LSDLQIFNNPEFGQVRTITIDDKDYFVGLDIAKALGYKKPSQAVIDHCKGIRKMEIPSNGGIQETNLIPEGDLYRLIVKSQLPQAEKFEKWVFDEVLPSIRKHGMYAKDEILNNPDLLIKVATELKREKEEKKILQLKNAEQEKQLEEQKPQVIFAQSVQASKTSILVGDLAKLIKQNGVNIGANRLFIWLRDNGYLIKRKGTDYNMPTQYSMDLELFEVKETSITHSDGHISVSKTPKVTGKGQIYFINKFIKNKMEA